MRVYDRLFYGIDFVLRQKIQVYAKKKKYCYRRKVNNSDACNLLYELIKSGQPIAAGRMGLSELAVMRMYEFKIKRKYEKVINQLYLWSGFFPNDQKQGYYFLEIMKNSLSEMDVLVPFYQLYENYFINKYTSKNLIVSEDTNLFYMFHEKTPWTAALKGKKVLVISPFSLSVEHQYKNREMLFRGTDILPEFQLLTYQSLLTIGDLKDDRFTTWFEALEFMKNEILDMDFDIALLGCGAYGFPLAAEIKKAGKQAVHMGGVLQLLFGIMGKRWDGTRNGGEVKIMECVADYYNEYWTYPLEEKPKDAEKIEYGPYWK